MTPPLPTGPAHLIPVGPATLLGTVSEFDEPRGTGVVRCADRSVPFHCTAITDGTRTIEVGTTVAVRIGPARLGRLEARSVRPLVTGPVDDPVPGIDRTGAHSPRGHDDYVPSVVPSVVAPAPVAPGPVASAPVAPAPASPFAPATSLSVDPVPADRDPVAPDLVVEAGEPDTTSEAPVRSTPSAWSPAGVATPVSGTPSVDADPTSGTGTGNGNGPAGERDVDPTSGTGLADAGDSDEDDSSPRPNFWSPYSRSPTGPPPTWSTPVTPKEPRSDGS